MTHVWRGTGTLTRVGDDDVAPGETFDATDAELRSFGDQIEEETIDVEGGVVDPDPEGEDGEDTAVEWPTDEHWKSVVADVEAGEYDGRLDGLAEHDDRKSVHNAIEARRDEL